MSTEMPRLPLAALALAVLAAAMWFSWLGWDDEYYYVDGVAQGPYRAWQVIGCGLCIALASVAAYLWVRGWGSVLVLAVAAVVGFAVPWTVHAASIDDTGLYAVGLMMILVGGGIGLVILLSVVATVAGPRK